MKIEWLERHRKLVEKLIKYGNVYARLYTKQVDFGTPVTFSASQVQTLEYILECPDQKMSEIARRLGITRSAFTKNVNKLMEKGLLEKHRCEGNNKDIYIRVSEKGLTIYKQYSNNMSKLWFEEMFRMLDQIPARYLKIFEDTLDKFSDLCIDYTEDHSVYNKNDKD